MDLACYTIKPTESVLEALKRIDENQKGFLLVVDHEGILLGTLTDGDIRRTFIKGIKIEEKVEKIYNQKHRRCLVTKNFSKLLSCSRVLE